MYGYPDNGQSRLVNRYEDTANGCRLWTGCLDGHGYGVLSVAGQRWLVHRFAYTLLVGDIPPGMDIDHMCHNEDPDCEGGSTCVHRRCIAEEHLVVATRQENLLRGKTIAAACAAQTHCKHGHEFTDDNTYVSARGRECRTCWRRKALAYYRQNREKKVAYQRAYHARKKAEAQQ